jgi:TPR repeat protein
MYCDGVGVEQDFQKAMDNFLLAAEQGYAGAQFNLGMMYKEGFGVQADISEATKWFRLAAEQGDAEAEQILAMLVH